MTASLRLVPTPGPEAQPEGQPEVDVAGDPDGDVDFFAMSAASAEQVTVQIRTLLGRGWEYVALAYQGRAFLALGYADWDAYVDARFGDLRITVPREHRHHAVAALTGASMSIRAIAKLLGVGVGTVHREMTGRTGVPNGTPDPQSLPPSTLGRDGKHYPRRTTTAALCRTCGEHHPNDPEACPWELYAQGTGPQPSDPLPRGSEPAEIRTRGTTGRTSRSRATLPDAKGRKPIQLPIPDVPTSTTAIRGVLDTIERAECLLDQIPDLEPLNAELDAANDVAQPPEGDRKEPTSRVRALEHSLRDQIAVLTGLLERLGRIAADLEPR